MVVCEPGRGYAQPMNSLPSPAVASNAWDRLADPLSARLLVVDDELPQLQALCELLEESGFEVVGHEHPRKALEQLEAQRFDVLLCDLMMPELSGIELMTEALRIDADIAPVLMTGHGSLETAITAMRAGAVDYVLKPFRLSAITPVIRRALELRRLRMTNRELRQQLEQQARGLDEKHGELKNFLSGIFQVLQGPLQRLLNLAGDIGGTDSGASPVQWSATLVSTLGHIEDVLSDVKAYELISNQPLQTEPVDLLSLMHEIRGSDTLRKVQGVREIRWVFASLPVVECDRELLRHAFTHLLTNAVKFTDGCETAHVEVEGARHGEWLQIEVRDNGIGFDETQGAQLFVPFHRLPVERPYEGIGMGLATVRRIVERHGGSVSARAKQGVGAVFAVKLPVQGTGERLAE